MYYIIINPASRSGMGLHIWKEQIEPKLHEENIAYRSYFSREAGDVANIAREICASVTESPIHLIILGGDGTVNEALQGIEDTTRIRLGYIPTGSSNDFARDLAIPQDPVAALDVILHTGKVHQMDLGLVRFSDGRQRKFAVSCGIGFDAAVCEQAFHSKMKLILNKIGLGKLTYLGIALQQLFAAPLPECTITLADGRQIHLQKLLFAASMIHRYEGGGFKFCPDADHNDGILNMCVVGDVPKLPLLFGPLPAAFKGNHFKYKGITPYETESLSLETSIPLWVQTDGESNGKATSLRIECLKDAIQMIY